MATIFVLPKDVWIQCHRVNDWLQWNSSNQTFETRETEPHIDDQTQVTRVRELFGVLAIGSGHSALLYVAASTLRGTLPLGHKVFEVTSLGYVMLPESTVTPPSVGTPGAASTPQVERIARLPGNIINEYRVVLDRFVKSTNDVGGSYFYYSHTKDLSSSVDPGDGVSERSPSNDMGSKEPSFLVSQEATNGDHPFNNSSGLSKTSNVFRWNANLLRALPVALWNNGCLVPSFVRGYFGFDSVDGVSIALCGRLSALFAGTRYNRRGLDVVTGMVANYSETVQLLWTRAATMDPAESVEVSVASYKIIRGSIPRCWEQPADLTFKPKIQFKSQHTPAEELRKHLSALRNVLTPHGSIDHVYCVDTTSPRSALECELSRAFSQAVEEYKGNDAKAAPGTTPTLLPKVELFKFDMGTTMKQKTFSELSNEFVDTIRQQAVDAHISSWRATERCRMDSELPEVVEMSMNERQRGVFRVNCLDCLDRSNLTQSLLAVSAAETQLRVIAGAESDRVTHLAAVCRRLRELWAAQGRAISSLYAGSDAHFQPILLSDNKYNTLDPVSGKIAVQRFVQQNFLDGWKQDAVSLITCAHEPGNGGVASNPFERRVTNLNLFVGLGFLMGIVAFAANISAMVVVERYRFRADFVGSLLLWGAFLFVVFTVIRRDPTSFTNYPVLR